MTRLPDIDLKLLRVFRAIVDAGSIRNAQNLLNLSQSTLSTQLSELEARLGFSLCQRGRKGFALTEEGRKLLVAMEDLFAAADIFRHEVANISGALRGVLRIGSMDAMLQNEAWPLASVMGAFSRSVPEASVNLALVPPHQTEDYLAQGKRDCVIGSFPEKLPSLEFLPLYQERNSLYAHKDHPVHKLAVTAFADLAAHPVLLTPQELHRFPLLRPDGHRRDNPRLSPSDAQMETHMILICTGGFIGFLPDYLAQSRPELKAVRATVNLQYLSPIYMAWLKGADRRILLRSFIDHVARQRLIEGDLTQSGAVQPFAA